MTFKLSLLTVVAVVLLSCGLTAGTTGRTSARKMPPKATLAAPPINPLPPNVPSASSLRRLAVPGRARAGRALPPTPSGALFTSVPTYAAGSSFAIGAAIGDLNGDGLPDLAVGNADGNVYVLLQKPDHSFQNAIGYFASNGFVFAVTIADFNGDGKPDIVAGLEADSSLVNSGLAVLLNNGDGTFQAPSTYNAGGTTNADAIAIADFNRDGIPDIAVASYEDHSSSLFGGVGVLLGNGDGTFQAVVSYSTGGYGAGAVAAGDLNRDGIADLVVADYNDAGFTTSVASVLLGNGDGTFQPPVNYAAGGYAGDAVAIGDFNGDGVPDVLEGNNCSTTGLCTGGAIGVLLGNGDGTLQTVSTLYVGYDIFGLVAGDFNADGHLDMVVSGVPPTGSMASLEIMLGDGHGGITEQYSYSYDASFNVSLAAGDLDGDGKLDLAIADECGAGGCFPGAVSVVFGTGDGTLQVPANISTPQFGSGLTAADFNGDSFSDYVLAVISSSGSFPSGFVQLFVGNGMGNFDGLQSYDPGGAFPYGVTSADVDGDGKRDIVVANQCASNIDCSSGRVGVLLGDGLGNFSAPLSLDSGGPGAQAVAVGDLDHIYTTDIAVANQMANTVGVIFANEPPGYFLATVTFPSGGNNPNSIALADLNRDGLLDIVVSNQTDSTNSNGEVSVLLNNGDHTFQNPVTYATGGSTAQWVAVGDFNGDGNVDVAVANTSGSNGSVGILLGNGDGTLQPAVTYDSGGDSALSLAVADFNGDGKLDIAIANPYDENDPNLATQPVGLLLGNGDGTFQTTQFYDADGGSIVAATDFNNDGHVDLLTLNPYFNFVTVLPNRAGSAVGSTLTTLSVSPRPSTYGQALTFTTFVTGNGGTPTGTVTYYDGTTSLGTATLDANGEAIFTNASLNVGTHQLIAVYAGDGTFMGSTSGAVAQEVDMATTTTAVTTSASTVQVGQNFTLTATVTGQYGGALTGKVWFQRGLTVLAKVPIVNGQANLTINFKIVGTYHVTASYQGDSNSFGSSASVTETIVKGTTTTALTFNPTSPVFGQPINFAATVSSLIGPPPDGEVIVLREGTRVLGTGTLSGGTATIQVLNLSTGAHTIQAAYSGDGNLLGSNVNVPVTVSQATTTTTLTSSRNPSFMGQSVTFVATVNGQFGGMPQGLVTFLDGSTVLGTVVVNHNLAALTTNRLSIGRHTIVAAYQGSTNYQTSNASLVQNVN